MSSTFRVMPAQRLDLQKESGVRYGFYVDNHPKANPDLGFFVASWDSPEKAQAAAHSLGYWPSVVRPISYLVPELTDD